MLNLLHFLAYHIELSSFSASDDFICEMNTLIKLSYFACLLLV